MSCPNPIGLGTPHQGGPVVRGTQGQSLSPLPLPSPGWSQLITSPDALQGHWGPGPTWPTCPSCDVLLDRPLSSQVQGHPQHKECLSPAPSSGDNCRNNKHQPPMLSHNPLLCHQALGPSPTPGHHTRRSPAPGLGVPSIGCLCPAQSQRRGV